MMIKHCFKQIGCMVTAGLLAAGFTACSGDDSLSEGKFTPYRLNISKGETLTLLGNELSGGSRLPDEYSTGLYKVDANGNVTAVETIVRYDEGDNATTETTNVRVVPSEIVNVDENFMILLNCSYVDDKGTGYPNDNYQLLVRKSDGLIYSLNDIYVSSDLNFLPGGNDKFYYSNFANESENTAIIKVSITNGKGVAEVLTTEGMPVPSGKLFEMDGGKIASTNQYIYNSFFDASFAHRATVVYPNGGYDVFGNSTYGFSLAVLNNSILEVSRNSTSDSENNAVNGCRWIHLGNRYGESNIEQLEPISWEASEIVTSFETEDKIILKSRVPWGTNLGNSRFTVLDKTTKKFNYTDISFSGKDNLELWKENLDGDRFYGLIRNANDQIVKACWLNPNTLEYGEIDLNLSGIDITTIIPDYKHGKVQLIGTRRSDGYKVAASADLRKGTTETLFSVPNREIITLIQLN